MAESNAIIRMNPERTLVELETPDGEEWGPLEWPEDQLVVLADPTGAGDKFLVVLDGYEGLDSQTIYKLTPVETETEEDSGVGQDDDGDDDDGDDTPVTA